MARILVIDDEAPIREILTKILQIGGHEAVGTGDGRDALQMIRETTFDLVICDVRMTPVDGLTVLQEAHALKPGLPFIMLTAFGSVDVAREAMSRGAFNFLCKPWNMDELLLNVQRAINRETRPDPAAQSPSGESASRPDWHAEPWAQDALRAAETDDPVLIVRSGGDPNPVARAIHSHSSRKDGPFAVLDCAGLPEPILEVEMMGCERGFVSGMPEGRTGVLESATGGTVVLDEIPWMPHKLQRDLVRMLGAGAMKRVGGLEDIPFHVRILATSTRSPESLASSRSVVSEFMALFTQIVTVPKA